MTLTLIKQCTRCGEFKSFRDFNKNMGTRDGLSCSCRECLKIAQQKKYQQNEAYRKEIIEKGKAFYAVNKPKSKKETVEQTAKQRMSEIFRYPSLYFCDLVGCKAMEFRQHIESKFLNGMESKDINKSWTFGFHKNLKEDQL